MPVLTTPTAPTHQLEGTAFTSLATPSRGSTDTSVWTVEIAPGTPATPHRLTREEIFVVLAGNASVRLDRTTDTAAPGDAIVVPPDTDFALANAGDVPDQFDDQLTVVVGRHDPGQLHDAVPGSEAHQMPTGSALD